MIVSATETLRCPTRNAGLGIEELRAFLEGDYFVVRISAETLLP